jgi:hypothetical protein
MAGAMARGKTWHEEKRKNGWSHGTRKNMARGKEEKWLKPWHEESRD